MVSNVRDAKIVLSLSLTSSAKTIIYPNSLILERQGSTFLRKKGRMKNLPIGVAGPVHRGGSGLILQTEPWLGFGRGAGGQCVGTNESIGNVRLGR
jgi:hypothetical protein